MQTTLLQAATVRCRESFLLTSMCKSGMCCYLSIKISILLQLVAESKILNRLREDNFMLDEMGKELIKKSIDLLNKFYDDLLHPPAQEVGFLLRDIAKSICLLGFPFMAGSAIKDYLSEKVFKIAESVPKSVRVMPNPQLFLDYLDKTKFIPNGSNIMKSFDRLLAAAINKEKRDLIHTAFVLVLPQLSEDEMIIINLLKNSDFKMKQRLLYNYKINKFYKTDIIENEFPLDSLHNKDLYFMYCTHLDKLDLINFPLTSNEFERNEQNIQTAQVKNFTLTLSEFGKLFVQACYD
jgi:hypothetical protein